MIYKDLNDLTTALQMQAVMGDVSEYKLFIIHENLSLEHIFNKVTTRIGNTLQSRLKNKLKGEIQWSLYDPKKRVWNNKSFWENEVGVIETEEDQELIIPIFEGCSKEFANYVLKNNVAPYIAQIDKKNLDSRLLEKIRVGANSIYLK